MIIFICYNASDRIRGELTRFLYEIDSGVYIGNISALVRDLLYEKIESLSVNIPNYRMIMIYPAKNENGFSYKYLGSSNYSLKDYDGLVLPVFLNENKDI